jgi:hypothetical protein
MYVQSYAEVLSVYTVKPPNKGPLKSNVTPNSNGTGWNGLFLKTQDGQPLESQQGPNRSPPMDVVVRRFHYMV